MLPRIIATDLDGTFLDPQGTYDRKRFDRLLAQLDQRGSRVVIATGDPLDHVHDLFGDLRHAKLLTYIVEDGAMIVDGAGNVLQVRQIPRDLCQFAIRWIQSSPDLASNYLITCGARQSYTELAADSPRFRASRKFYPGLTSVPDLLDVEDEILKLDVTWEHDDVFAQVAAFNRQFAGQLLGTSSGLGGMNVTLPTVSKGNALSLLQQYWGVTTTEMAAFGDSGNDLAMLQQVGEGIAMANATPEVLALISRHTDQTNQYPVVLDQLDQWLGNR
ncbi:HAD-IIB family hydrolase [Levilactobacillus spicheri]